MPRGDGTGPMNMGQGRCSWGSRMARGQKNQSMTFAPGMPGRQRRGTAGETAGGGDPTVEREFLKGRLETLQAELNAIQKRLNEIDS